MGLGACIQHSFAPHPTQAEPRTAGSFQVGRPKRSPAGREPRRGALASTGCVQGVQTFKHSPTKTAPRRPPQRVFEGADPASPWPSHATDRARHKSTGRPCAAVLLYRGLLHCFGSGQARNKREGRAPQRTLCNPKPAALPRGTRRTRSRDPRHFFGSDLKCLCVTHAGSGACGPQGSPPR